jgi:hypothetical protein
MGGSEAAALGRGGAGAAVVATCGVRQLGLLCVWGPGVGGEEGAATALCDGRWGQVAEVALLGCMSKMTWVNYVLTASVAVRQVIQNALCDGNSGRAPGYWPKYLRHHLTED